MHRSALGDYNEQPIWEWTVSSPDPVIAEVSLDGSPYRRLPPAARSYRPARPLEPGEHRLTIRIKTALALSRTAQASATAHVAALPGQPIAPDDPCYPDPAACGAGSDSGQWALRQIRWPQVWQALDAGALRVREPVVVAVLDTGYLLHPDLTANLDPAIGYDLIMDAKTANDGGGIDPDATDPGDCTDSCVPSWHGTAVAGVIAAQADNGTAIAGMGWPWGRSQITIMPVRVLGVKGGETYDLAQGLLYAAGLENDSGTLPATPAKIINLSLAEEVPGPPDEVLEDALRRVTAAGAIVVAAAGNNSAAVRAPANSRYTIAVGSVSADGSLAAYSNFGPEIDIVAPGGDGSDRIWTLDADPGAQHWTIRQSQGTSLAAPHVSGALALLAGIDPSLTLNQARTILADSAVDLGEPGRDDRFGPGMLDAYALFGAYPARRSVQGDRPIRTPRADGVAPSNAHPQSLIVRWRAGGLRRAAAMDAGERLRLRHAVADVRAGGGAYALVRLHAGQDRQQIKARLEADPAVAAVYYNRIYRPAGSVRGEASPAPSGDRAPPD